MREKNSIVLKMLLRFAAVCAFVITVFMCSSITSMAETSRDGMYTYTPDYYSNTCSITAINFEKAAGKSISIPSKIDGLKVKTVYCQIYFLNPSYNIKSIVIPSGCEIFKIKNTILSCEESNFYIGSITFPKNMKGIYLESIRGLKNITLPSGLSSNVPDLDMYYHSTAIINCQDIETIYLKGTPTFMPDFSNDVSLKTVKVDSTSKIETLDGNFYGCTRLKSVTKLNNVYSVGEGTFDGCKKTNILKLVDCNKCKLKYVFSYGAVLDKTIVIPPSVSLFGVKDGIRLRMLRFEKSGYTIYVPNAKTVMDTIDENATKRGNVTIVGAKGSYAQEVAKRWGFRFKASLPTFSKVTVKRASSKTINVSWTKVKGATEYIVYRRNYYDTNYGKKVGTTKKTSIIDKKYPKNKSVIYTVIAKVKDKKVGTLYIPCESNGFYTS